MNKRFVLGVVLLVALVGLFLMADTAKAKFVVCPWWDLQCPQIYDPVTCDGGVVYPNACEARRHCATGCGAPGS